MTASQPVETILVVDDEPSIRNLIGRVLEHQGYHVLQACSGQEALSVAADHRGRIDLLVTDVVMPRMDGFTLGERLVELRPDTQVLFISGHANLSVAAPEGLEGGGQAFLLKPFTHDRLLRTIRERLDTAPAQPSARHLPSST